ncbi:thioredoxin domain-containing protein [Methylobacterium sp. JK268]
MTTRRQVFRLGGAALGAALVAPSAVRAEGAAPEGLMDPGPLPDLWLGPAEAKVAIVEYASLTCPHCAAFHRETWPALKARFVDAGQVRFVLRAFCLNGLDVAAFMVARRENGARYYPLTDLLFDKQADWAFAQKPLEALDTLLRQAGIGHDDVAATLKDQALYQAVNASCERAETSFGVDSTPTFFVNGRKHEGETSIEAFADLIKAAGGG